MTSLARPVCMATVIENLLKRRWSATILRHLAGGSNTVAEIIQAEPELSILILNERMRAMVRYKLIIRTPPRPLNPTVGYTLTPRGHKILCLLNLIGQLDELELGQSFTLARFRPPGPARLTAMPGSTLTPADSTAAPRHPHENDSAPPSPARNHLRWDGDSTETGTGSA